jgi:serine protease AprX
MKYRRVRFSPILCAFLALAGTSLSCAQSVSTKISPDAAAAPSNSNVQVIIQYYSAPSSQESSLLGLVDGLLKSVLQTINALVAIVPQTQLIQIAADSNVKYISLDRPVTAHQAGPITSAEYTAEPINAPVVWREGYSGTNIGVAVIDSGITPVADLSASKGTLSLNLSGILATLNEQYPYSWGRILYSQNFVAGANDASDHYGHGTHVAGLIAGNGAQSTGSQYFRTFKGTAPNAGIVNLRALDNTGAGTDSSVISAIQRAISLQKTFNIRVINLSLGRPIFESYALDPLCQAVEKAWKAGIVVVVAAGNDGRNLNLSPEGYGTIDAPGNDPYVLTVGAMRTMETAQPNDDLIASYSSKGPTFIDQVVKPDIVAPGNLVTSLKYANDSLAVNNPSFYTWYSFFLTNGVQSPSAYYFPLSGTSMAAAVTSGAIADLLQAVPQLAPDQVKALVMANGQRSYFPQTSSVTAAGITYKANYDIFTIGAGYLDIAATVKAALVNGGSVPRGTAMSPFASYNAATGVVTASPASGTLWTQSGTWSASNVYGTNAFLSGSNSAAVWGATPVWSDNDPYGFAALWSNTALWGKGTPDAETALWGKGTEDGQTALWGKTGGGGTTVPFEF